MRYSIERSSAQVRKCTWLMLYRDNSVLDSDLRIAAVNTNAMAIEEIDSDEERRSRLRRKKETLEMDDNFEFQGTRGTEGSDARGSRDPVPPPVETSIAQRSAPDLVLWSSEPGGLLEPAQEERKARGKSVPIGPNQAEKATHELTHTSLRNWCSYCVRARAADDPHHRQPHKSQRSQSSWKTTVSCRIHLAVSCSQSWTCWTLLSA